MIYLNPTTSQNPLFSLPRGTVLSVDNMVSAPDGVWIHVFDHTGGQEAATNPAGSGGRWRGVRDRVGFGGKEVGQPDLCAGG